MDAQYQVSVIVVTYHPNMDKLLLTLNSLLAQKDVRMQIVIADDGSKEVDFTAAKQLFARHSFEDYTIVANPENRGTVYNLLSGVEHSRGEYIKPISPGDLLSGETVLCDWLVQIEKAKAQWSFCDVVCYEMEGCSFQLTRTKAHPLTVECYQNGDLLEARWNYLIYNDLILGAATLCRRALLADYLMQIAGKVTYAEDNIYRLMLYDGVCPAYYPCDAVVYEYGSGISTSGNDIWAQRLAADWDACNKLLFARGSKRDSLDYAMGFAAKGKYKALAVKLWHVAGSSRARQYWKVRKKNTRRTGEHLPLEFLQTLCDTDR